jgi:DNA-binding transcriptional ArsR family regulator
MVIEQVSKCSIIVVQSEEMGTLSIEAAEDASDSALAESESLHHPEREEIELAAVLHALSDPMRLQIVAELAEDGGERSCNSFDLPIVKSTCTHHFKVLRESGVIRQRVAGTKRVSLLRSQDLEARFPGLLAAVLAGTVSASAAPR